MNLSFALYFYFNGCFSNEADQIQFSSGKQFLLFSALRFVFSSSLLFNQDETERSEFPSFPGSHRPAVAVCVAAASSPSQNITCALKCFCLVALLLIPVFSIQRDFILWTYCMSLCLCWTEPPGRTDRQTFC